MTFRLSIAGAVGLSGLLAACGDDRPLTRAVPSYDSFTSRLVQVGADQDGDGRLDQWTYLDGPRTLRGEADADGDGRIDRWEYFDVASALVSVGASSRNDGIEDTWTFVAPDADGTTRVDHSRSRDRQRDRSEFFRGTELVLAEEDSNGDGRPDRWDRYEGTVLREAAFDTTMRAGGPNRRLVYDAAGRFEAIESDPVGNGTFERLPGALPPKLP